MRGVTSAVLALAALGSLGEIRAQRTVVDVKVDLQPCILAKGEINAGDATVSEAYVFQEFFKGFWAPSQYHLIAPDNTLDLTVDGDEYHGRCNAVFVGIVPTAIQRAKLTAYSRRFQARIVYLSQAETPNNEGIMTRLGLGQYFAGALLNIPMIKLTGNANPRVVNSTLRTFPQKNDIYTRPVRRISAGVGGTTRIVADYADSTGTSLVVIENGVRYLSAAIVTHTGNGGEEEMHIFFALSWFDTDSWAWAHYIAEWATKGIFAGERRFWLGATVDDLFLSTAQFEYGALYNQGAADRLTGAELSAHLAEVNATNARFNAELVTEFAFNGNGILAKVGSPFLVTFRDGDAGLLAKGKLPTVNPDGTVGLEDILDSSWWSQSTIQSLKAEFKSGAWNTDDLMKASIAHKDDFFWQSHTMNHLARDNLGESDCAFEDGANAQMAVILGLFASDNYDWHSMTTPGITGLFNKNCLASASRNLITCAPGDNTFDGVRSAVRLVSDVSQFHSIYTKREEVGFKGFQIVPRYATYIYYNCVTAACCILENLYVRRTVCGCADTSPGTIHNLNFNTTGCNMLACPLGLQAMGTAKKLFEKEAETTTRYILTGRRDKYMFHQLNVIPTNLPSGKKSLLDGWYEAVLVKMSEYLNLGGQSPFPMRSVKFDDLCTNFAHHEDLDYAGATVTMTLRANGRISGMSISSVNATGVIPITIPSSMAGVARFRGLPVGQPYAKETYGSDTTYYVATSQADIPIDVTAPSAGELAPVPL